MYIYVAVGFNKFIQESGGGVIVRASAAGWNLDLRTPKLMSINPMTR